MNYMTMLTAISKELGENYTYSSQTAHAVELWSKMYKGKAPWNMGNVCSAGISASIASEVAKLVTIEFKSNIEGSELLNNAYQNLLKSLRKYTEYGLAKGSLIIKPIVDMGGIRTQFIQADRFFPIDFDGSGELTKCVLAEQIRQGKTVYTLLEIHSMNNGILTVENKAFKSLSDGILGSRVSLSEVPQWADLAEQTRFLGIDSLPFGLFKCPPANNIDSDSPLGVSVYSRATELIREADKRYSQICWEYESKETAIHVSESMLKYNKEQDSFEYPQGKDRLYRAFDISSGATDKPLIETFSPDIRSSSLFEGYNNQLRMIEFACSLAYGTISDPNNIDKTATEIKASKQRSYTLVSDCQAAMQKALEDWAKGAFFWLKIYRFENSSSYKMNFEWGDSILADPDSERKQDIQDLNLGIMRPEEYRAKWYGEDEKTALNNLPQSAEVMEDEISVSNHSNLGNVENAEV